MLHSLCCADKGKSPFTFKILIEIYVTYVKTVQNLRYTGHHAVGCTPQKINAILKKLAT